jgi:hypothetical protein
MPWTFFIATTSGFAAPLLFVLIKSFWIIIDTYIGAGGETGWFQTK